MKSSLPEIRQDGRYSITDASRLIGVSRNTLYRYIGEGMLKTRMRKVNGRKFIHGSELIKLWEASV